MNDLFDYEVIDDTFSDCAKILRDKLRNREITQKQMNHFLDSLWILCNCAEKEWTIDFGLGKENERE